jgi:hypothetical protein
VPALHLAQDHLLSSPVRCNSERLRISTRISANRLCEIGADTRQERSRLGPRRATAVQFESAAAWRGRTRMALPYVPRLLALRQDLRLAVGRRAGVPPPRSGGARRRPPHDLSRPASDQPRSGHRGMHNSPQFSHAGNSARLVCSRFPL